MILRICTLVLELVLHIIRQRLPVVLTILLLATNINLAKAHHNKGGSVTYICNGVGRTNSSLNYTITITHYIDCDNLAREVARNYVNLGIFIGLTSTNYNNTNRLRVYPLNTTPIKVDNPTLDPCITGAPEVCFYYRNYQISIDLPINADGYTLVEQDGTRTEGLTNLYNSGDYGWTYDTYIPATIQNSSPVFSAKNMAGVICHNNAMQIDLSASDPDGDELRYEFSAALDGPYTLNNNALLSLSKATPIPYTSGYSGTQPMGALVTLNATTGMMEGVAPNDIGAFNIAYYVIELRNGVEISRTKREILFSVADCSLKAIQLNPTYVNCDGLDFTFQNENQQADNYTYTWDFGDGYISSSEIPKHTYTSAGDYILTVSAENGAGCKDQTTTTVRAYPGFFPDYTITGACYLDPIILTDNTKATYGTVNSWNWQLGDGTEATTSTVSHHYTPGSKSVTLTVGSDKGCLKTITKSIEVIGTPVLELPYTDTLLCVGESILVNLQNTNPTYTYSWYPNTNISNTATASPTLSPKSTTDYTVTATDKGCMNSATIHVAVVDHVTLQLQSNENLCIGDSIQLSPISDGLRYTWTSDNDNSSISDPTLLNPYFYPSGDIKYILTSYIGHCSATASTTIKTSRYAYVNAGSDQTICEGNTYQLQGKFIGSQYTWKDSKGDVISNNNLTPTIRPYKEAYYILAGRNDNVCTKLMSDTIFFKVIPQIYIQSTQDTNITTISTLQLNALANNETVQYRWSPASYLNNSNIANPTLQGLPQGDYKYIVTAKTPEGCTATNVVKVRVFGQNNNIYIPSAFTPNGDGLNDILQPTLADIKQVLRFSIYNRWGKLMFTTTQTGQGWDGRSNGDVCDQGTYVYTLNAITAQGKTINIKGSVALIR